MKYTALLLALSASAFAAPPSYKVVDKIAIGGESRWDYLYMDSSAHRLYVSHGNQVEVVDTEAKKVVGTISGIAGSHGIAIAHDVDRGYITSGNDNSVAVFDLKTLKVLSRIKVGSKPDAIVYDASTRHIVAFNGHSNNASVIDSRTDSVSATAAMPSNPEFGVVADAGKVYFNLEDSGQLGVLDVNTAKVSDVYSLAPCEAPSGLAKDTKQNLFSVCRNNLMMITSGDGKTQNQVKIGAGPDGVAFMDGLAFSANGSDGTISVVSEIAPGKFENVATIATAYGARTIAADPATHRLYLPTAEFKPQEGKKRRQSIADTFYIVVIGKQNGE